MAASNRTALLVTVIIIIRCYLGIHMSVQRLILHMVVVLLWLLLVLLLVLSLVLLLVLSLLLLLLLPTSRDRSRRVRIICVDSASRIRLHILWPVGWRCRSVGSALECLNDLDQQDDIDKNDKSNLEDAKFSVNPGKERG